MIFKGLNGPGRNVMFINNLPESLLSEDEDDNVMRTAK